MGSNGFSKILCLCSTSFYNYRRTKKHNGPYYKPTPHFEMIIAPTICGQDILNCQTWKKPNQHVKAKLFNVMCRQRSHSPFLVSFLFTYLPTFHFNHKKRNSSICPLNKYHFFHQTRVNLSIPGVAQLSFFVVFRGKKTYYTNL